MERILIVDDETVLCALFEMILKKEGFETKSVGSAEKALELIDSGESFDLILTDIMMPRMNGIEFVKVLREREIATPVIAMTGAAPGISSAQIEANFNGFLKKPFTKKDLVLTVKASLISLGSTAH